MGRSTCFRSAIGYVRDMPRAQRHTFFAVCAPGIEPLLHAETKALRLAKVERQVGGVRFEGTIHDAWRANLHLRTAIRVLLRLERFPAANEDTLYRGVRDIDWRRFISSESSLVVAAQTRESRLDHSLFIEQRTKDAIADQFLERDGVRPSVDKESPDLVVHVHFWRDRCTLSVDTSGASLHKRGWRCYQGRAPLAETLAAAIVLASGWNGKAPLIDPFCGSGTLLVEAALIANNIPPGSFRDLFAFERFPDHDVGAWKTMRASALNEVADKRKVTLMGNDADRAAVEGARENLVRAGLDGQVELAVGDAASIEYKSGWNASIVTNPPYGERVGDASELTHVYRRFGEMLRSRCGGYSLTLLAGNERLARCLALRPTKGMKVSNGALPCELLQYEIPK